MATGSLATWSQLNASFLGQPFVYRSYPEESGYEESNGAARLYAYLPYLRPAKRREEGEGAVCGRLRDTVNINKRSQEAVSRSVDFIGPSRLSSFRFFFQQPAITPRRSFTRAPLPFLVHGIPSRVTARIWKCTLGRIFLPPFFLSFIPPRSNLEPWPRFEELRSVRSHPRIPASPPWIIRFNWRYWRWKESFFIQRTRFIRLINYAPAVDLNLFILDYPPGLSWKMIVFDGRKMVNG